MRKRFDYALGILSVFFLLGDQAGALTVEYQFHPTETSPTNQGWSIVSGVDDSESIVPTSYLVITDNDSGDPGVYYTNSLSTLQIDREKDWQARVQLRLAAYDSSPAGRALFFTTVRDGWTSVPLGVRQDGAGNTIVFFSSSTGTTAGDVATNPANAFLEVVMTKVTGANTNSFSDDNVTIDVYDFGGNLLGTGTKNIGNIDFSPGTGSNPRLFFWGMGGSPAFGTAQIIGATFGIEELAPSIIPEPSTILVVGLGGLILALRRSRTRG